MNTTMILQNTENPILLRRTRGNEERRVSCGCSVYRDYARDQQSVGSERVQLIKDCAQHYDAMDDAKARNMVQRVLNIDAKLVNLRREYWPKFDKALGAKQAAKFFQLDNRLSLLVNLQLASEIPLLR
jgi:hypothetical protein